MLGTMQAMSPKIVSSAGSVQQSEVISFAGTADLVADRNYRFAAHPAQPGDEIVIWTTGLGGLDLPPAEEVQVKIGDVYAGAESVQMVSGRAGLFAIQVRLPAGIPPGEAVPVQLKLLTTDSHQVLSNIVTATFESVRQ
jgi:uncharacterized protein (TIGR03437 family)